MDGPEQVFSKHWLLFRLILCDRDSQLLCLSKESSSSGVSFASVYVEEAQASDSLLDRQSHLTLQEYRCGNYTRPGRDLPSKRTGPLCEVKVYKM